MIKALYYLEFGSDEAELLILQYFLQDTNEALK
jgi:hypothetical protein